MAALVRLVPALWLAAVAAFAAERQLFDDEWFSLELARQGDRWLFWESVNDDLHPPWLPLLDRAIGRVTSSVWALRAPRFGVAFASIWLLVPVLQARVGARPWLVWLGALHPVVGMYVGTLRWYPFLMLAQALRTWAVCTPEAAPEHRSNMFAAGAVLGVATVYVDPILTGVDLLGWAARASRLEASTERPVVLRAALVAAGGSVLCVLASAMCSELPLSAVGSPFSLRAGATWALLGAFGEALPPQPWRWLAPLYLVAFVVGVWYALRGPSATPLRWHVASSGGGWAVATQLGVSHPRYSLLLWCTLWACALSGQARGARLALLPTLTYMGAVWTAMVSGQGFYKADLNRLRSVDCQALRLTPAVPLCVVPYAGLAAELDARCALTCKTVRLPSVRIVASPETQLAPLREALRDMPPEIALLWVNSVSSLRATDQRVRETLRSRGCRVGSSTFFGAVPYPSLRRILRMPVVHGHYAAERWHCPSGPEQ
jgi:hypothetical protein